MRPVDDPSNMHMFDLTQTRNMLLVSHPTVTDRSLISHNKSPNLILRPLESCFFGSTYLPKPFMPRYKRQSISEKRDGIEYDRYTVTVSEVRRHTHFFQ